MATASGFGEATSAATASPHALRAWEAVTQAHARWQHSARQFGRPSIGNGTQSWQPDSIALQLAEELYRPLIEGPGLGGWVVAPPQDTRTFSSPVLQTVEPQDRMPWAPDQDEDVLDWDFSTPAPPPYRSGTVRARLRFAGRSKPIPVEDPMSQ